jgi:hypothetical protein
MKGTLRVQYFIHKKGTIMTKKEQREAIEIWKMIKHYQADEDLGGCDINADDTYESIKKDYFEDILGYSDTVEIELDLSEEMMSYLYKLSDEQGKIVDEVVLDLLEEFIEQEEIKQEKIDKIFNDKEYRILKIGEKLQEGDEFFCHTTKQFERCTRYFGETIEYNYTIFRRKIAPVQYRLLNLGERILPTDEFYHVQQTKWINPKLDQYKHYVTESHAPYRRKI